MRRNPAESTFTLLHNYSFESAEVDLSNLVFNWLNLYPSKWVVAAIVEAIYQGRYKVESVSRILNSWHEKGYPSHHFDYDFADVVCKKLASLGNISTSQKNSKGEKAMNSSEQTKNQTELFKGTVEIPLNPTPNFPEAKPVERAKNTPNSKIGHHEKLIVYLNV